MYTTEKQVQEFNDYLKKMHKHSDEYGYPHVVKFMDQYNYCRLGYATYDDLLKILKDAKEYCSKNNLN